MIYFWRPATGLDVTDIVNMAQTHFEGEIDKFFTPDPVAYSRNVTLAVVNQFYLPTTEMLAVCRSTDTEQLLAYVWAKNHERSPWSDDDMVVIRMAHLDLTLPNRTRYNLITDMIKMWETFAYNVGTPVVCSTTMREDRSGFLRLHERLGYTVRGSYAYKRLNTT